MLGPSGVAVLRMKVIAHPTCRMRATCTSGPGRRDQACQNVVEKILMLKKKTNAVYGYAIMPFH